MFHPIDTHVGKKLKELRILRDLSQVKVADKLGLSFQQLQKYETGGNRVSASRLYELAQLLDVNTAYFFSGLPGEDAAVIPPVDIDAIRIASMISKISDPGIKKKIGTLIAELSS